MMALLVNFLPIRPLKMKLATALCLLAFAVTSKAGVSMNDPFYCYSTDWIRPQNQMHSVRTSYEAIRRTEVNPTVSCEFRVIQNEFEFPPKCLEL